MGNLIRDVFFFLVAMMITINDFDDGLVIIVIWCVGVAIGDGIDVNDNNANYGNGVVIVTIWWGAGGKTSGGSNSNN